METKSWEYLSFLSRNSSALVGTFLDCSTSLVPLWAALIVGLLLGWAWKPRWVSLVFLAIKSRPCVLWTSPPGLGARRLWLALTAVTAFPMLKDRCIRFVKFRASKCSSMESAPPIQTSGANPSQQLVVRETTVVPSLASSVVGEHDLRDLRRRLQGRDGGLPWVLMMERSAPGMIYQAWCRDPKEGPTEYKSRTVFEDSTPELVKDFYWDDEFRSVWDDMLIYTKALEGCEDTGAEIAHWIRKFPFFCSDREYLIGRRIFELGGTFFCITKAVPYATLPRRDKPLRVDIYYSSWCVRAAKSTKNAGQTTACEVTFFHAEDMHIPKRIAKIGVRQGMWGCVRKMEPGLRKYQVHRSTVKTLSKSAYMAQLYTRVPANYFEDSGSITSDEDSSDDLGMQRHDTIALNDISKDDAGNCGHFNGWKWLIVGGAVILACGLDRGALGRGLVFGLAKRFGKVNRRL